MADMTAAEPIGARSWRPAPMSERVVVRCFDSYQDAKRAVDSLTVARIPRKRITVFGRGMRWREAFSAERFVKASAIGGAALGTLTAIILWALGALDSGFTWFGALVLVGALSTAAGAALGLAAWQLTKRAQAVPETGHVDVDHYELLVEVDHAERARQLLDAQWANPAG
jgi:hypothetical protein